MVNWSKLASPRPASAVCNPDAIISEAVVSQLNDMIFKLESAHPPHLRTGVQLAVTVIHSMAGNGRRSLSARDFSKALFDSWGIGHKLHNNGILLLLAIGDRQTYIRTGRGMTRTVTELDMQQVLTETRQPTHSCCGPSAYSFTDSPAPPRPTPRPPPSRS
jgi:uncharacterized protein